MKKKCGILVGMIISLMFLVGFGKKSIELLNNKKLIDLNVAIEKCIWGAETLNSESGVETEEERIDELAEVVDDDQILIEEEERTIVIRVRGESVTYDSIEENRIDKLADRIRKDNGVNVIFKLVDDFAEAHVYKEVMSILSELELEVGLNYTKE